jgi:hypothetical protein
MISVRAVVDTLIVPVVCTRSAAAGATVWKILSLVLAYKVTSINLMLTAVQLSMIIGIAA